MPRMPFSSQEFFDVFAAYNEAVWPAQILLLAAAVAAVAVVVWRGDRWAAWVWGFLAVLWAWTGVAYHLLHFTEVNPAAFAFGVLFVAQGLLLLWCGVVRGPLPITPTRDVYGVLGGLVLAYALVVYPLLGALAGQAWFASPTFGAPCPVVIYTFGIFLLTPRIPLRLLVVPAAWAVLGISAVFAFGVMQDAGLLVSGVMAVGAALHRRGVRRSRSRVAAT